MEVFIGLGPFVLFDTLLVFLKEFFENVDFGKKTADKVKGYNGSVYRSGSISTADSNLSVQPFYTRTV